MIVYIICFINFFLLCYMKLRTGKVYICLLYIILVISCIFLTLKLSYLEMNEYYYYKPLTKNCVEKLVVKSQNKVDILEYKLFKQPKLYSKSLLLTQTSYIFLKSFYIDDSLRYFRIFYNDADNVILIPTSFLSSYPFGYKVYPCINRVHYFKSMKLTLFELLNELFMVPSHIDIFSEQEFIKDLSKYLFTPITVSFACNGNFYWINTRLTSKLYSKTSFINNIISKIDMIIRNKLLLHNDCWSLIGYIEYNTLKLFLYEINVLIIFKFSKELSYLDNFEINSKNCLILESMEFNNIYLHNKEMIFCDALHNLIYDKNFIFIIENAFIEINLQSLVKLDQLPLDYINFFPTIYKNIQFQNTLKNIS